MIISILMGNNNSSNNSPVSSHQISFGGQDLKQVQISMERPHGLYFTGEIINGTVEIPLSYLQQNLRFKNNQKLIEFIRQQSLRDDIVIELIGDATYSAEVDVAADSDGHATHKVNLCRQFYPVKLTPELDELLMNKPNQAETSFDNTTATTYSTSDTQDTPITLPTSVKGTFQLQIPDGLPPSLINNRAPSILYTLELNLPTSRSRYQIPINLNYKGSIPHHSTNIELSNQVNSQREIFLQAYLGKRFYRSGEKIPVGIKYINPQQRMIRSITVTLVQFYRVHHDQYQSQLDGKEWVFDTATTLPQQEWHGETLLQLPGPPLQSSFSSRFVGTTQSIECELDYRIFIELSEKKGDNIHLTLPSIDVTYQI